MRLLLELGESVRVFTRDQSDQRVFAGLNVEVACGDVRDRAAVAKAMQDVQAVIHSAGFVHIGWSQADLHQAINVEGNETCGGIGAAIANSDGVCFRSECFRFRGEKISPPMKNRHYRELWNVRT